LREKCRLRVFENGVVRKIFEPKSDEVEGGKLQTEEFYDLHSLSNTGLFISP
jgi:hypothetical protein